MNAITGIMIGIITITIIVLVILGISFLSQLYKTVKEVVEAGVQTPNQIYCPFCGSNKTDQITKRAVIIQLPRVIITRTIKCACFYCSNCSNRWFVELNILEQNESDVR